MRPAALSGTSPPFFSFVTEKKSLFWPRKKTAKKDFASVFFAGSLPVFGSRLIRAGSAPCLRARACPFQGDSSADPLPQACHPAPRVIARRAVSQRRRHRVYRRLVACEVIRLGPCPAAPCSSGWRRRTAWCAGSPAARTAAAAAAGTSTAACGGSASASTGGAARGRSRRGSRICPLPSNRPSVTY